MGQSLGEDDIRSVTDLLIEQIEFCDVLLVSKTDEMTESQRDEVVAILHTLNPSARILPIAHGQVPMDEVLNTGRFNMQTAAMAPGWLQELRGTHTPETEHYGIGNFVYQARRPFHPQRFHDFLSKDEWGRAACCAQKGSSGWRPARFRPAPGIRPGHSALRVGGHVLEGDSTGALAAG